MEGNRYYWIKLDIHFFDDESPMDYIMSLEHGSEYVCLYLKLCMISANKDGKLANTIGEVNIPYDIKKITREVKYFEEETVAAALDIFRKLGLISNNEDGVTEITNYSKIVGSETSAAERMRKKRNTERNAECNNDCNAECNTERNSECNNDVTMLHIENRDKSIRDKSIDIKEKREKREEETKTFSNEKVCCTDVQQIVDEWNQLEQHGINKISRLTAGTDRYKMLNARIKQYGVDKVIEAVDNVKISPFLCGSNNKNWIITFDWFVKPNNFIKVLDGNYTSRDAPVTSGSYQNSKGRYDWDNL